MARIWDEMYFAEQITTEAQLRQRVEADPRRVNDWDTDGKTPLYTAACELRSLPLVLWLLDEKGADVNARCSRGYTALYWACSLDILTVLLDRGGDPTVVGDGDWSPLTSCITVGNLDCLARLLQDPRVRAIVDVQDRQGWTALHKACHKSDESRASYVFHLLLQAGASPAVMDKTGKTPSTYLQRLSPSHHTTIALLEQALDQAEKAALLVKARRLVLAAQSKAALPSHLQGRMDLALPLPRLKLLPATNGGPDNEGEKASHHVGVSSWVEGWTCGRGYAEGCFCCGDGPAHAILGPIAAWHRRRRRNPARIGATVTAVDATNRTSSVGSNETKEEASEQEAQQYQQWHKRGRATQHLQGCTRTKNKSKTR
jgi:ankyrin repeat protein